MGRNGAVLRNFFVAAAAVVALQPSPASGQDIRVLLIHPATSKAVPADALQTVRQAILDAAPGVVLVRSAAEATDLVELTHYEWSPDDKNGVTQTWQLFVHPLRSNDPQEPSARPSRFRFDLTGRTLAESTQASSERMREVFGRVLPRFRRVVPG